jgi:uncharacterized protein (DUF2141 family)
MSVIAPAGFRARGALRRVYNESMTHSWKWLTLALTTATLAACGSTAPATPEPRPAGTGSVEVTMTGFKNEEGLALVAFFLDESGWPDPGDTTFATISVPIHDGQAVAEFDDVPAGRFAVSAFHDENGDRKLNTGALGIPSEDYGFSADARNTFGPPSFAEASLELAAGETKQITIRVK